jgi:hypothetical protein
MLPMMYGPNIHDGGLWLDTVRLQPFPRGFDQARASAKIMALAYWRSAAEWGTLSAPMRDAALANLRWLERV